MQIGAGFRGYKLAQEELQIGAASGISNQGKNITNRDKDYKLEQDRLQTGAGITNRCRTVVTPPALNKQIKE